MGWLDGEGLLLLLPSLAATPELKEEAAACFVVTGTCPFLLSIIAASKVPGQHGHFCSQIPLAQPV